MRRIKILFIGILFSLLFIFGINVISSTEVIVSLKQQESSDSNGSIRYVGIISGINYTEINNYSVSISMYDTSGSLVKSNTKSYTTLYDKVTGVSEVAVDNLYYAVFTLTDLDSYSGYKLDCYFSFNLKNGEKYLTNHKYFEIGTNYAINTISYAGYDEGCFMEFSSYNNDIDPKNYIAEYRDLSSDTWEYITIDNELIRYSNNKLRVDMVGLSEGNYSLRVSKLVNGIKYVSDEVTVNVSRADRSGYAHFGYSSGVGAYNNDGTLKSDAVVVYVSDSNKNTVNAKIGSKTYNGLANILQNQKGTTPLVIRVIGRIGAATWNELTNSKYTTATTSTIKGANGQYLALQNYTEEDIISGGFNSLNTDAVTKLNGLTNKIKYDSSKKEFDSYYNMLDISSANNVTIEGIGTDAEVFQWGFTFKNCNSIEVKNLSFTDSPEDACSFEASTVNATTSDTSKDLSIFKYSNYWVHNNTFNIGKNYWDVCSEQDKHEGDGSTDVKYVKNVTFSYNKYVQTHKTGLVGGNSNHLSANITYHHNYYDNCQSRMPYARQANMHMYNNYYSNSTGTTMQIYAGAYAFIENCYFENDKKTFDVQDKSYATPAVKSYNNIFNGSKTYESSGVTHVNDRETSVANGNLFNPNFDTDSSFFYYDSVNKRSDVELLETAEEAKTSCVKYAGVLNSNHYNSLQANEVISTYIVSFNNDGNITEVVVNSGDKVSEPTNPTKAGYTFDGWYLEDSLYDFNKEVTSNITLTAKWTINSATPVIDETITYSFRYSSNENFINPEADNKTTTVGPFTFTGNGYFSNNGTGWTYFYNGSTIKFTLGSASSITIVVYANSTYEITGNNVTNNGDKYYVGAGEVTITSTANGYIGSIAIVKGETDPSISSLTPTKIELSLTNVVKASSNTTAGNGVYYTNNFKQIYSLNESLDLSNLYAFITFSDNSKVGISNTSLSVTGFDSSSVGKKTITITYNCEGGTIDTTYDVYVVSQNPSIINDVMQVKVSQSYTGTIGAIVDNYNMFNNINQALDYIRKYESSATNKYLYIDEGTYNEKIEIDIPNLHIVGAGASTTIIEYNSLYGLVEANGFKHVTDSTMALAIREKAINCIIENITISNYYNHIDRFSGVYTYNDSNVLTDRTGNGERGLALLVQADKFIMKNCRLLGWQDTLETFTGRQYFYNTYICGAVDFIFGTNSTTYFQNCNIEAIKSKTSASSNSTAAYVTAYKGLNKSNSDAVEYGAIFDNCNFTTSSDFIGKVAFIRPWTVYSAVAIINSTISNNYLVKASETIKTGLAYVYGSTTKVTSWNNIDTLKFKVYNNSLSFTDDISGITINLTEKLASNYSNFTVIFGKTNGGVSHSEVWNVEKITDNNTEEPTPTPTIVHNFTTDGTSSSFFTISGNLSTGKGTVSYSGLTLTQCLKMESATSISFTVTNNCTLKLVFVETAPTIKIDGTKYTETSNVISIELNSGSHTITKADTANLFYIELSY